MNDTLRRTPSSYYREYGRSLTSRNDARTTDRVRAIVRLHPARRGRLLCVGIGSGLEPNLYRQAGFEVTAIDISSEAVEQARSDGFLSDVVDLDKEAPTGTFDTIACCEVLEHLFDPRGALAGLASCLAPGGRLYVTLPNEFNALRRLAILVGHNTIARYDHPHLRFFDGREPGRLFRDAGLTIQQRRIINICPPRYRVLRPAGVVLGKLSPSLFSASSLIEATREENGKGRRGR